MKRALKHIFKQEKVFIKEDHQDPSTPAEYFYTMKRFLGKIVNFDSKHEKAFEDRHLKAYLAGHERFQYKKNWFNVQKGVIIIPLNRIEVEVYTSNASSNTK